MANCYGIDLGTTNTVVYEGSVPLMTENIEEYEYSLNAKSFKSDVSGATLGTSMPSVMYVSHPEDEFNKKIIVGEDAQTNRDQGDKNLFLMNTKRMTGENADFGYGITPMDVATEFLKKCAATIKRPHLKDVCITHPASYNIFATVDTKKAAIAAGFAAKHISVLEEPKAALLSYLYDCVENEKDREELFNRQQSNHGFLTFLVVDIGGGTTDVTVQSLRINHVNNSEASPNIFSEYSIEFINRTGETNEQRSSSNNYHRFGGMDFDNLVAEKLLPIINEMYSVENGKTLYEISDYEFEQIKGKILKNVELYKIKMSRCLLENIDTYSDPILLTELYHGWSPIVNITAIQYMDWVKELCDNTDTTDCISDLSIFGIIKETLIKSKYTIDDLSCIFITGGMSQCIPIRKTLAEKFKNVSCDVVFSSNPLTDVARGAAIYCNYFYINTPATILNTNYYIDNPCGMPLLIAKDGDELPTEVITKEAFLKTSSPLSVTVSILAGKDIYDKNLRLLNRLRGELKVPEKRRHPIDVRYSIADDQELNLDLIIHHDNHQDEVISVSRILGEETNDSSSNSYET